MAGRSPSARLPRATALTPLFMIIAHVSLADSQAALCGGGSGAAAIAQLRAQRDAGGAIAGLSLACSDGTAFSLLTPEDNAGDALTHENFTCEFSRACARSPARPPSAPPPLPSRRRTPPSATRTLARRSCVQRF